MDNARLKLSLLSHHPLIGHQPTFVHKISRIVRNARIAQIEGRQPATILPADVAAALKSAGPATPPEADPTKPQIPNDPNRPMAGLTAQIMPELYYDGANGWQQRPAN